jgi:hypothetical protein
VWTLMVAIRRRKGRGTGMHLRMLNPVPPQGVPVGPALCSH